MAKQVEKCPLKKYPLMCSTNLMVFADVAQLYARVAKDMRQGGKVNLCLLLRGEGERAKLHHLIVGGAADPLLKEAMAVEARRVKLHNGAELHLVLPTDPEPEATALAAALFTSTVMLVEVSYLQRTSFCEQVFWKLEAHDTCVTFYTLLEKVPSSWKPPPPPSSSSVLAPVAEALQDFKKFLDKL
jgi:hypothetical protein